MQSPVILRALAGRRCLSKPLLQFPRRTPLLPTHVDPRLQTQTQAQKRTYFSLTPSTSHMPTITPTVRSTLMHAGASQLVGATVILALLYTSAYALDLAPWPFAGPGPAPPPMSTPMLDERLGELALPPEMDLENDALFALMARCRPVRYVAHIREAREGAERARAGVMELEKVLEGTECACRSVEGGELRKRVRGELREARRAEREVRERWVRLWLLDLSEGAARRRGRKRWAGVRRWMGWDLEGELEVLVKVGLVKV
ncbi:uncharacterized protein H6S33_000678 [Morchella sextelata]|uniref:uncharacterized protein n=1 Tax=Morchella sextelata TaxID=1174677 RepID=UPI001D0489FB|nr:uncharacterized protein H6S33_000678 [Morchella sextelata]KAH0615042.1 hypothetical protein H6S33_000678 [Morchella sextelata]